MELKLLLLRYNMLSKERTTAAYMWRCDGERACYESKWSVCVDEMVKMRNDLRKSGYEFARVGSKVATSGIGYNVYKIVPMNDEEESVYPL